VHASFGVCEAPPVKVPRAPWLLLFGLLTFASSPVFGLDSRTTPTAPQLSARAFSLGLLVEARPPLRLGATFIHFSRSLTYEHSLTTGFGSFPNLEIRSALNWDKIEPLRVWMGYRVRRITLEDLPPIEQYFAVGLGLTSDVRRRFSLYANFGVEFQLPPLVSDAARDFGTYAVENVGLATAFGLRMRLW
jgi:hypothetical protein